MQMLYFKLMKFLKNEKGSALTEYGLLIGIIVVGAIAILTSFRDTVIGMFQDVIDSLNAL